MKLVKLMLTVFLLFVMGCASATTEMQKKELPRTLVIERLKEVRQ